ncbi:hypothetical protein ACFLYT_01015, partial [Nanoarchaeota archaeon]
MQKIQHDVALIKDNTGAASITTTADQLNLDTEVYNSNTNAFLIDTANDRIYANQTGWYKIYASMTAAMGASGVSSTTRMNPATYIRRNGATLAPSHSYSYVRGEGAGANTTTNPTFLLMNLTEGDYVDIYKYLKEDGSNTEKPHTVADESWLLVEYLGTNDVLLLYDSAGGDILTTGSTATVIFDTVYHKGGNYSYTPDTNNIYLNQTRWYEISYQFGWDDLDSGGRHTLCAWVNKNGAALPYTRQCGYSRGATGGRYGTIAGNFIVNNTEGDYYELQHYVTGGDAEKEPDSVWFSAFPLTGPVTAPPADDFPSVSLDQPPANYINDSQQYLNITFNATATDDNGLLNCSLWHNISGTFALNQTQLVSGLSDTPQFSLNLTNTSFIWNIG